MTTTRAATPLLIGGEHVRDTADVIVSIDPATGQVNHEVCAADARHVDAAVAAARDAAANPAWRDMLPHKRARLLSKVADIIESRAGDFARAQMLENGKVLAECRTQATSAAATFRYYAAVCETLGSDVTPSRGASQ